MHSSGHNKLKTHTDNNKKVKLIVLLQSTAQFQKAKEIDGNFWLVKLEELVRKDNLGEEIDVSDIDENSFPDKHPNQPGLKFQSYCLWKLALYPLSFPV